MALRLLKGGFGRLAQPCLGSAAMVQTRNLNVHEYLAHELMQRYEIKTPRGAVASSVQQAVQVAEDLGTEVVVKAQVLAGGRGKGAFDSGFQGGVHMADTPAEAGELAGKMIGNHLITKQTGEEGRICEKVLIVEKMGIKSEFYFAILMDRATNGPIVIASSEGGMDIETVAAETPEAIHTESIDITVGMTDEQAVVIAKAIGMPDVAVDDAAKEMKRLYDLFISQDATMVEINPMALSSDDEVICMDAKFNFDDNAAYRQAPIFELRDYKQENALEVTAAEYDLNYIGLDGQIGCLVNGAGLAMATMDIIELNGGSPANFLDVGGGATADQVEAAFKLITSDPKVNCILVNIFGGIMRCDVIAEGVIRATRNLNLSTPVVLRLQGTKVEEAKAMVASSGLDIISSDELDTAARKAVLMSKIVDLAKDEALQVSFKNVLTVDDADLHADGGLTPKFT